ncbi:hypothetical protein [Arthrobacter psychrolactophilus]|uniref:hypothetical protein n=1 Tax=Arthrobacter psychrolactophilus TaxID=92442 RepID=UPI0015E8A09F|nr:hypothetical protein [Arthrobacter psychrolactophilus]
MIENTSEPVEISTRMAEGEWTPESLAEQLGSYQDKLREMGAPDSEIETSVETPPDGSATVKVSWQRTGSHTFAEMGQSTLREAENSRGHGEVIPPGEATEDSKGLGAVYGDAERSAIDEPPTRRAMDALEDQTDPDLLVYTTKEGKTYVEDAGLAKE